MFRRLAVSLPKLYKPSQVFKTFPKRLPTYFAQQLTYPRVAFCSDAPKDHDHAGNTVMLDLNEIMGQKDIKIDINARTITTANGETFTRKIVLKVF